MAAVAPGILVISDVLVGQLGMLSAVLGVQGLVRLQVLAGYPLVVRNVPVLHLCVLRDVPAAGVDARRRVLLHHDHHLVPVAVTTLLFTPREREWGGLPDLLRPAVVAIWRRPITAGQPGVTRVPGPGPPLRLCRCRAAW